VQGSRTEQTPDAGLTPEVGSTGGQVTSLAPPSQAMLWSMPATPHLPPMLHMASTSHMPSMPHMQPMASMPFMASMPPMPWGFPPQLLQSQMPLGFTPLSTYVPRSPGAVSINYQCKFSLHLISHMSIVNLFSFVNNTLCNLSILGFRLTGKSKFGGELHGAVVWYHCGT
jgi:hypothetical protein